MEINQKSLGAVLIALSIILLFIFTFVKLDRDNQTNSLCSIIHENKINIQECQGHETNFSWLIIVAYSIEFIVLIIGIYTLIMPIKNEEVKQPEKVNSSKLDDVEKKIFEILKDKEGSVYQTDLVSETGYSKVKITRILDKMETKGILERRRRGMTNIIVLK